MDYKIDFFRNGSVVRRETRKFDNLEAATNYGLSNTGPKDSPDEVDGFDIYVGNDPVAERQTG
jgi:hypothetical protein